MDGDYQRFVKDFKKGSSNDLTKNRNKKDF